MSWNANESEHNALGVGEWTTARLDERSSINSRVNFRQARLSMGEGPARP